MIDNDNLELKKRSRRRLVGAAALALVAAIVLPMVMDDEPGVPAQDIQVTIPDREADSLLARPIGGRGLASVDGQAAPAPFEQAPDAPGEAGEDLPNSPVAADAPTAPPLAAAQDTPEPAASQPREPAAAVTPVTPAPRPAADSARPARAEPRPGPQSDTPAPAPERKPASTSAQDEAARVKAILEGRLGGETVAQAQTQTQTYVVQVGAFSERATADSLKADLNGRGFKAFTEQAGKVTRVRVGPYGSRGEAEQAADRLAARGLKAVVTLR